MISDLTPPEGIAYRRYTITAINIGLIGDDLRLTLPEGIAYRRYTITAINIGLIGDDLRLTLPEGIHGDVAFVLPVTSVYINNKNIAIGLTGTAKWRRISCVIAVNI